MKTALRALGYSAVLSAGAAAFISVWLAVLLGVSELAVWLGASRQAAPLFGLLGWLVILCSLVGTGIAVGAEKERADAAA